MENFSCTMIYTDEKLKLSSSLRGKLFLDAISIMLESFLFVHKASNIEPHSSPNWSFRSD